MGSLSRRIRRNIMAANLAHRVGVKPPPALARRPDGSVTLLFSKYVSPTHYRTSMLRLARGMRKKLKDHNALVQANAALKEKRTRKVRNEGSMVRRAFAKVFGRTGR